MWNYWNHRRQEKERTRLDEAGVNADLQKSALIAALLGKDHKSIVKLVYYILILFESSYYSLYWLKYY